jgi:hypothetical protein
MENRLVSKAEMGQNEDSLVNLKPEAFFSISFFFKPYALDLKPIFLING